MFFRTLGYRKFPSCPVCRKDFIQRLDDAFPPSQLCIRSLRRQDRDEYKSNKCDIWLLYTAHVCDNCDWWYHCICMVFNLILCGQPEYLFSTRPHWDTQIMQQITPYEKAYYAITWQKWTSWEITDCGSRLIYHQIAKREWVFRPEPTRL